MCCKSKDARRAPWFALVVVLSMLVFAACAAPAAPAGTQAGAAQETDAAAATGPVQIGSKDFTEAILVAELYAQVLERAGFTVERKFNLGATPIAHEALLKGDIDLYPEYTSTGLQEVLKDESKFVFCKALATDKRQVNVNTLYTALFSDLPTEKDFKIPTKPEKRERILQELIQKVKKKGLIFSLVQEKFKLWEIVQEPEEFKMVAEDLNTFLKTK